MNKIIDDHHIPLDKNKIDSLFYELNKVLRKKLKKQPRTLKATLYVVGGACVVTKLQSRVSTNDIDAMWDVGTVMRECINEVGDNLNLGHDRCNCDFKRTKSYTDTIVINSSIYKEFDRLVVRMVNLDLLLAMKLVSFRVSDMKHDMQDILSIIKELSLSGVVVNKDFIIKIIKKYYGSIDILSEEAKTFIGLE